jgi:hypothetical protein
MGTVAVPVLVSAAAQGVVSAVDLGASHDVSLATMVNPPHGP